jgi:multidrug efflux system membrane fusion protein
MPRYIRATSLACLLLLSISCSSEVDTSAGPGGEGRGGGRGGRGGGGGGPVPVVTTHVTQKSMPVRIPAVGTVEALSSVQIRAQVPGQLGAIHFAEGQDVTKGQRLFSLDPRPFQAALQQAEAVLARDTANAKNADAQKGRAEDLFKRGLIARDQYETQVSSAAALEATVAADKAAVENAKLSLQYAEISAPIAGRTGALGAHVGDLIRANDTNPMVVINQLSPVYVSFSVPGRYLPEIRRFQGQKPLPVTAMIPTSVTPGAQAPATPAPGGKTDPGTERGVVSFIDNAVDPTTGTIRLKGTFQNADRQLWPGVFVQVNMQLTTDADALVVPATAVQASQDGPYVYVVKGDRTVEMRTVKVDRQLGDEMILAEGVKAGEEVVTDGHLRLTPGARVSSGRGEGREGRGEGRREGQGAASSEKPPEGSARSGQRRGDGSGRDGRN